MTTVQQLVIDLKNIAAPELPRDREIALSSMMIAPKFDEKAAPGIAPLARMAKSLGLALRRGLPPGTAARLHIIAGELAAAIAELPEGYRPPADDHRDRHHHRPYWTKD